jgi:hypothetical protein
MTRWLRPLLGFGALLLTVQAGAQTIPSAMPQHRMVTLADVKWVGGADGLASAVVEGNPQRPDSAYSLLLRLRDGRWIPPHWHPRDKAVVVLQGTLLFGSGESIDSVHATVAPAGSIVQVPATMHHYEGARGETILLLYGKGPLITNYVK